MTTSRIMLAFGFCGLLASALGCDLARAAEDLTIPTGTSLELDGRPNEPAWTKALRLPAESIRVPAPPPAEGFALLAPVVRMLVCDGRLWVAVEAAEDPGAAIGLHLFVAADDTVSAADAASLGFRPVSLRSPRYAVRGPRGAGRDVYRLEGAAQWQAAGRWSLEACIPVSDLVGEDGQAPLRIAAVVFSRTPNVVATAPPSVRWTEPRVWQRVLPPGGGWGAAAEVESDRMRAEDAADRLRRLAWRDYLEGLSKAVAPNQSKENVWRRIHEHVLGPLERVLEHRPDLRVPVLVLRGDVSHRLGAAQKARADFEEAVRLAPGWREALYALHVRVDGQGYAEGAAGQASDYTAAFARLQAAEGRAKSPWVRVGCALGRGMLRYKHGDFREALPLLEALGKHYPHDAYIRRHASFTRRAAAAWAKERMQRKADAARKQPRAHLETPQGTFTIELFVDEFPNTVSNFVWLGRNGFYDGLTFHRTVPFFLVQGGDPFSAEDTQESGARLGTGTPGYVIPSEEKTRPPLRGMVAMANLGPNTEGSQFFIFTGTAAHLAGEQVVFGRVVEGMDVVDRIHAGVRIKAVTFSGLDPERAYRPNDHSGRLAPKPKKR